MTMGARIVMLRVERHMTQSELARRCGLPRQTIDNYEKNKRYPCLLNAICIADVLDISLDRLVGRERR